MATRFAGTTPFPLVRACHPSVAILSAGITRLAARAVTRSGGPDGQPSHSARDAAPRPARPHLARCGIGIYTSSKLRGIQYMLPPPVVGEGRGGGANVA